MYRLARNHTGLVRNHPWDWYLDKAYETVKFMFSRTPNGRRRVGYVELGLMEGDIILAVLEDLKREGWQEKAQKLTTERDAYTIPLRRVTTSIELKPRISPIDRR